MSGGPIGCWPFPRSRDRAVASSGGKDARATLSTTFRSFNVRPFETRPGEGIAKNVFTVFLDNPCSYLAGRIEQNQDAAVAVILPPMPHKAMLRRIARNFCDRASECVLRPVKWALWRGVNYGL